MKSHSFYCQLLQCFFNQLHMTGRRRQLYSKLSYKEHGYNYRQRYGVLKRSSLQRSHDTREWTISEIVSSQWQTVGNGANERACGNWGQKGLKSARRDRRSHNHSTLHYSVLHIAQLCMVQPTACAHFSVSMRFLITLPHAALWSFVLCLFPSPPRPLFGGWGGVG